MMAVHLHNFELLLPSDQFFTTPGSVLSSPIGSDQLSSSSTEEEDDYIGELTRHMAQSMLHDEDKLEKSWPDLSGSPESTLWSQFGSNLNSPIGPSREPSPPLKPMVENFEKMEINEEAARYNQAERFSIQSKQALRDEQIRTLQLHRLKQEQAMKQMEQKQRIKHYHQSKGSASLNSNNPWYNLQHGNQQAGSHMRAFFLNKPGSKNGSSGTGVFLPRGIGGTTPTTESRKKQGCATVLIPARVVQALKLHFEKTGVVPTRSNNNGIPLHHNDACVSGRNNYNSMYSLQKGQSKTVQAQAMNHQEMSLPQEWTY